MTTPTTYVRHTKKTEWGLGMLVDNDATYFRYFFEDGELRSFSSASLSFLAEASASAAEIEALQGLKTSRKRALGADKKKKKTISEELRGGPDSTRKVAAAAPVISTLKQQLERFSSHFPKGFEDEKYIDQERGGHGSRKIGRQGVVDLARESLASAALRDNVMLKLKGIGTANLYKKLIHKGKTLFANEEIDSFSLFAKTPPNEQRLCEALVDMLHGQGPVGPRLEALTTALPVDLRTWRLCSFPGAFFHPETLLYVDPEVTFRQAHIVGIPVSFQSTVSGATYEQLLAMARKLSEELHGAGLKPRDLIDVHLFTAHTLRAEPVKKKKLPRPRRRPQQSPDTGEGTRGQGAAGGPGARGAAPEDAPGHPWRYSSMAML